MYDVLLEYVMRLSEKISTDYGLRVIYIIGNFPTSTISRLLLHADHLVMVPYCYDELDISEVIYYSNRIGGNLKVLCSREDEIIKTIKKMGIEVIPCNRYLDILEL